MNHGKIPEQKEREQGERAQKESWEVQIRLEEIPEKTLRKTGNLQKREIKKTLKKILNDLASDSLVERELSILITSNEEIRRLNREFRGKDRPTDVLSFPQRESLEPSASPTEAISLGDIVVSLDTTLKQAESLELSTGEELLRLIIHGLLHLLGYEHEKVEEQKANEMFTLQDSLFNRYRGECSHYFLR